MHPVTHRTMRADSRAPDDLSVVGGAVPNVTAQSARVIRDFGHEHRWPVDVWLDEAGIDCRALEQPGGRVSRESMVRLFARIEREIGDPGVVFEIGRHAPFGAFDVVDYLVLSAATIRDAFDALNESYRLIHDPTVVTLDIGRTTSTWMYHVAGDGDAYAMYAIDLVFATIVAHLRHASGTSFSPAEVWLPHDRRACAGRYEQFYGCPVRFEFGEAQLVLRNETLAIPMPGADAGLHAILRRHVSLLLERLPNLSSSEKLARLDLRAAIQAGGSALSLESTAQRLGVSARTLQRRLREEGTTFQRVLDDVRREFASRYLADEAKSISDIAFAVGFSDVSAFHRAFRRWTGRTPGEMRSGDAFDPP